MADAYWRACDLNLRAGELARQRRFSAEDRRKALAQLSEEASGEGCQFIPSGSGLALGGFSLRTSTGSCIRGSLGAVEKEAGTYLEEHERKA